MAPVAEVVQVAIREEALEARAVVELEAAEVHLVE
jgi:hypothetical protein